MQTLHQSKNSLSEDYLIDSLPIMLAWGARSKRTRLAAEIARCGFSAVKQTNFHGVRLDLLANKQSGWLPIPARIWLREGNVHDLIVLRQATNELPTQINLFGDNAYDDRNLKLSLKASKSDF